MEATAAPRALSILAPSPPPQWTRVNSWRVSFGGGVRRRGALAVGAKKRRGRREDGEAEERVDSHSFVPKAGEVTGTFPEAVLLKKVAFFYFLLLYACTLRTKWHGCFSVSITRLAKLVRYCFLQIEIKLTIVE
jgi:hypothetical protein